MRFPLIREFTASYRASPNRDEWLRAWHDASMNVRKTRRARVIVQVVLTLGFLLSASLTAVHRGDVAWFSIAIICLTGALAVGYRHFAEIDYQVLEIMRRGSSSPANSE